MFPSRHLNRLFVLVLSAVAFFTSRAEAQAPAVEINQMRAVAGGIDRGDSAGFPVTLRTPGHYVFTSDLVVPAGRTALEVLGNDITVDMNGFSIRRGPALAALKVASVRAAP